jgi:hypothetical protein
MMAYNPAIGRVLEKDGVVKFANLMSDMVPRLYQSQTSRTAFDEWHAEACQRIRDTFKTARGKTLSYGQAQKPVNVFLKVYVDWARQPSRELAEKLTPWLHVPLDKVVMKFIRREFGDEYDSRIGALRRYRIDQIVDRLKGVSDVSPRAVAKQLIGAELVLAAIDKETYVVWQEFLRELWPGKPVQLDIVWVLERRPIPAIEPDEDIDSGESV